MLPSCKGMVRQRSARAFKCCKSLFGELETSLVLCCSNTSIHNTGDYDVDEVWYVDETDVDHLMRMTKLCDVWEDRYETKTEVFARVLRFGHHRAIAYYFFFTK